MIKLIHGDCLEEMKKMTENSVDIVVTSPPYNINLRIRGNDYCRRSKNEDGPCNKYTNFDDALSPENYFQWQRKVIVECMRVCKNQVFYIIQPITGNKEALFCLIGNFHKQIKEIIIWDKKNAEPAIMRDVLNSEYEFIIVFDKTTSRQRLFKNSNFKRGTISNIFRIGKSKEKINGHKATFPLELCNRIISYFSKEGDTVLDCFTGSGTTGIACKNLNRNFIGIELDKTYFDIASNRINNMNQLMLL